MEASQVTGTGKHKRDHSNPGVWLQITNAHTHTQTCTRTCTHTYTHKHTHAHAHTDMHMNMHTRTNPYLLVYKAK